MEPQGGDLENLEFIASWSEKQMTTWTYNWHLKW